MRFLPALHLVPASSQEGDAGTPAGGLILILAILGLSGISSAALIGPGPPLTPFPIPSLLLLSTLEERGLNGWLLVPATWVLAFVSCLLAVQARKPRRFPAIVHVALLLLVVLDFLWVIWPRSGYGSIDYLLMLQVIGVVYWLPGLAIYLWALMRYRQFTSSQALAFYFLCFAWLSFGCFTYIGEFP